MAYGMDSLASNTKPMATRSMTIFCVCFILYDDSCVGYELTNSWLWIDRIVDL